MKYYLILLFFLHLSSVSSSSQLREKLPSDVLRVPETVSDDNYGTNKMRPSSKIGHDGGSTGNNGGSRSPYGQGGAAVIPVYGAGGASMHHRGQQRHHGTAGHSSVCIGLSLSATALALAATQLYI